jgi:hypothetical protein
VPYDCSARTLDNIAAVFETAQKLVIYPVYPIFDVMTNDLTPEVQRAFARIFRVFDHDCDGVLSDDELNRLQVSATTWCVLMSVLCVLDLMLCMPSPDSHACGARFDAGCE